MGRFASGRVRVSALAILVAAGVIAVPSIPLPAGAATAQSKPKPKPNLVVRGLEFKSTPSQSSSTAFPSVVLQSDKHGRFGLTFTIKNSGKARSHNRHAGIYVAGRKLATQLVGPIAPGKATTFSASFNPTFTGPGLYDAYVCMDAKNCSKHVKFTAIPKRWIVDTFSTGPNSPAFEPFFSAHSVAMTFDFYGTVKDGAVGIKFLWLATGGVDANVEIGGANGCTYHGTGAVAHSPWDVIEPEVGYLMISPETHGYSAEVVDKDRSFIVTGNCPGITVEGESVFQPLSTVCSLEVGDCPSAPNAKTLAGSYNFPTGTGNGRLVGQWSFRADLP